MKLIKNNKISFAVVIPFIVLMFQYFLIIVLNNPSYTSIISIISKIVVGLVYIWALPKILNGRIKVTIIIVLLIMMFLSVQYLMFPDNRVFIQNNIFDLIFICLPSLIYSFNIIDFKGFYKILNLVSYIIVIIGFLLLFGVVIFNLNFPNYSMALSYYMLLPSIVFISNIFIKKSFINIVLTLLSVFIIITFGARGPIFIIIIYLFMRILVNTIFKYSFKYLQNFVFLVIMLLIALNINSLIEKLYNFLLSINIYSRTLYLLINNDILATSRTQYYSTAMDELKNINFFGEGIFYDRILFDGAYVHNLFLEILLNYGYMIGIGIILIVIGSIIYTFFVSNKISRELILIFVSIGLLPLFFSSSYLINYNFWILIGFIINIFYRRVTKYEK